MSVVGARPRFIKAAVLSSVFTRWGVDQILGKTGQHYAYEMAPVSFDELGLRPRNYLLGIGSGSRAQQTAVLLQRLKPLMLEAAPNGLCSTASAAAPLPERSSRRRVNVGIAHVAAGLRWVDLSMPEEINRIVAAHLRRYWLGPTEYGVAQLRVTLSWIESRWSVAS